MSLAAEARHPAATGEGSRPLARLHAMVRQRDGLAGAFGAALRRHEAAGHEEIDLWAAAALELANVNAGPYALVAFFRLTATTVPAPQALARLAAAARGAADVCRKAGAAAVRACLDARIDLAPRLAVPSTGPEAAWWRGLVRLATEAPGCVAVLAGVSGRVVAECGTAGFEAFAAAGLRASGADPAKQQAFFSLEDPEAQRMLDRLSGQVTFGMMQGQLRAFASALWGSTVPLRESGPAPGQSPLRRTTFAGRIVRVPDVFKGVAPTAAPAVFKAAVAHATAHLALGGPRFEVGTLKPVQLVLVAMVEDARIEALAMRRFPGLRRLWAPFHTAVPSPLRTAPVLLARLAHALFDPDYQDDDGFVSKGRRLFFQENDLADPTLSRRLGGMLGNDFGQMRIQFSPRLHVVEPVYRDDGFGLWDMPPPPDAPSEHLDVHMESVRPEPRDDDAGEAPRREPEKEEGAGRAKPVPPDERGIVIATYPEWDRAAELYRPEWTTIREVQPRHGTADAVQDMLAGDIGLRRRVERLVRGARVGRTTRLRRQPDGLDLDLDAAIDAATALRIGEVPDERIHQRKVLRTRDLAVSVLIDVSQSTRERVPAAGGASVIEVEKMAVAVLAGAMGALGDRFALRAFASNGRDEVRLTRVKDFDQPFDAEAEARLAGLQPAFSTRLGAALRHAGAELGPVAATRRIVLALTDGEPSDIDVSDPTDLVEDARRATRALHNRGIDVFGITLDPSGHGSGSAIFGRANHKPVRRIEELPSRLSELYFRVARR